MSFSSRPPAAFKPPIPALASHDTPPVLRSLLWTIRGGRHSVVISDHYGVSLSDQTLNNVFKHEELRKDLSTEEGVFITTSDGNHTSRLCWYGQKHHCMYLWLMIWLCDWELTLTSILELLYLMYVMHTGENSRAGAICSPNERWWRWSLAADGLNIALTASKNTTHTHL